MYKTVIGLGRLIQKMVGEKAKGKGEDVQEYYSRLARAMNKMSEEDFNKLPEDVRSWVNCACKAIDSGTSICDLDQKETTIGKPRRKKHVVKITVARKSKRRKYSDDGFNFNVSVSFEMQYTFSADEVQPDYEGNADDYEPSESALAGLTQELEDWLGQMYSVDSVDVNTESDQFLGFPKRTV